MPDLPQGAYAAALKALSQRKANATYGLVPGAHHYVQAEQPGAVVDASAHWWPAVQQGAARH